jgi:hypothetical protein
VPALLASLTKPRLLIGEGVDEVRFFNSFLKHLSVDDIQIEQYGGKSKLSSYLKSLPNIPGFAGVASIGHHKGCKLRRYERVPEHSRGPAKGRSPESRHYWTGCIGRREKDQRVPFARQCEPGHA